MGSAIIANNGVYCAIGSRMESTLSSGCPAVAEIYDTAGTIRIISNLPFWQIADMPRYETGSEKGISYKTLTKPKLIIPPELV